MVDEFRLAARPVMPHDRLDVHRPHPHCLTGRPDQARGTGQARRTGQAGASLIEVVVAVMLVSTIVLGLATAFVTLMRINRGNAEQQRVDHAVDNVAEQLKAVSYVSSGDRRAGYTAALALSAPSGDEPAVTLQQVECRVRSTAATPAAADLYDAACTADGGTQRVTLRGEWRGRSREAQIVLRNR